MSLRFWHRRRRSADLDEEIQSHLKMAASDRIERGEPESQAAANARREFGNVGLIREITREMSGWSSLERAIQDIRFGVRVLAKSPIRGRCDPNFRARNRRKHRDFLDRERRASKSSSLPRTRSASDSSRKQAKLRNRFGFLPQFRGLAARKSFFLVHGHRQALGIYVHRTRRIGTNKR
jgi:hypothetical protein